MEISSIAEIVPAKQNYCLDFKGLYPGVPYVYVHFFLWFILCKIGQSSGSIWSNVPYVIDKI